MILTEQEMRSVALRNLLIYGKLVELRTLMDSTTHEAEEIKDAEHAVGVAMADCMQFSDELIGGFRGGLAGNYSPAIRELMTRQNKKL